MTERVSDEQIARDIAHARAFQKTVDDTFIMPAGYPADLRDARVANATLRQQLADAKTAAWIEGRDAAVEVAEAWCKEFESNPCGTSEEFVGTCRFATRQITTAVRALQPPSPSPVEAAAEPGSEVRS